MRTLPPSIMAGTSLVLAVCLLCLVSETAAFEARITKPIHCDRNEVRFHRGHQYLYHYSTTVETTFVGTTASKSAFRLDCEVVVEARRKCEAYLNVTSCSLFHRQPGEGDVYIKDTTLSADVTHLLSREMYFQFDSGTIRPHTIVVDSEETNDALNIKRGILSALQIKIMDGEPGDQDHTMETVDVLGTCPTEYEVESPGKVLTFRDITRCQIPHYSYRQHNLFSMIKKVYGGFLNSPIDELIYPFNSTIKCEHTLGDNNRLEETRCLQQQVFRPFAREGTIVATCMANISQHLVLQQTRDLLESNANRKMRGKKSGSLGYEFDDLGENILVTKDDISHWLHKLTVYDGALETTPKLFHEFLWFLRQAQTNDILEVLADVWNCHGNQGNYCNKKFQTLEQDYLHDGLLACGTDACISAFTQTMRAGHVSRWLEYMFVYDVALYHESSPEVASTMLEMCIERSRESCWFPLSILINKIATAGRIAIDLESGPVYRTLHHVRETMGDTCHNGISSTLTPPEKQNAIGELLQMIKVRPRNTIIEQLDSSDN
ncbi:apolipoprotein B-100-like [Mizuhopecten yessoensis]|uniref:Apolipoprotein B-100 n=1 Tax=Mizuhopecten yessoensis TaxID=6573 RepID=A0A210Q2H4_MIZYE|nr:apolipoprotein B-100-like [Mizuhopecten yessoensis]OWF42922.1 Apolipoprotein B-100 [Mizuhopecten yessoensis]